MENDLERLRAYCDGVLADNDTLRKEIERLRAERDEARMESCRYKHRLIIIECPTAICAPQVIAENRGWDCFKE